MFLGLLTTSFPNNLHSPAKVATPTPFDAPIFLFLLKPSYLFLKPLVFLSSPIDAFGFLLN
jgi:hypothetical protein